MTSPTPGRGLIAAIVKNFVNSLKPKGGKGVYKGDDYFGNTYYEIPADPSRGKRLAQRWIKPAGEMETDQEKMPAEWDAWLRNRRVDPPTEEELKRNMAISMMKKENAAKTAEKEGKTLNTGETMSGHSEMSNFPIYEDMELNPGEGPIRNKSSRNSPLNK